MLVLIWITLMFKTKEDFDDEGYPLPSSLIDPRDRYYEYDDVRLLRSLNLQKCNCKSHYKH